MTPVAAHRGPRPRTRWHDVADRYRRLCGERMRAARQAAGLSTYQLAKAIGITDASVIGRYETDGVLPAIERMYAIADALGTTVNDIWGFR